MALALPQNGKKYKKTGKKHKKNSYKLPINGQNVIKITKIMHQLELLAKTSFEFKKICLKNMQNGQKCHKTATKMQRIGQNPKKWPTITMKHLKYAPIGSPCSMPRRG